MSTFQATIRLGPNLSAPTHTWVVDSGDPADESATSQVLDGLTIGWSFPENAVFPAQPAPTTLQLALLLDDVAQVSDLNIGDVCQLEITSGGATLINWQGRIAQPTLTPVRRKGVTKARLTLPIVDFLQDLAGIKLTIDRPAETAQQRFNAIADAAWQQVLDTGVYGPTLSGGAGPPAGTMLQPLAALSAVDASAYDLLDDVLRQAMTQDPNYGGRLVMFPYTTIDPSTKLGAYSLNAAAFQGDPQTTYAPGVLTLAAHKLGVTFDGASPSPAGLTIDSGLVDEGSVSFTALRYSLPNRSKVTGGGLPAPVYAGNGVAAGVEQQLSAELLTTEADAVAMGRVSLPPGDDVRWQLDGFKWRPSDADLAALDYPLAWRVYDPANVGRKILAAQVVITPMPAQLTPGTDSPFYGGSLQALALTILAGDIYVSGKIARRLATSPTKSATVTDVKTNFPTVKLKTGVDVVDPTLSVYEAKLARKM